MKEKGINMQVKMFLDSNLEKLEKRVNEFLNEMKTSGNTLHDIKMTESDRFNTVMVIYE